MTDHQHIHIFTCNLWLKCSVKMSPKKLFMMEESSKLMYYRMSQGDHLLAPNFLHIILLFFCTIFLVPLYTPSPVKFSPFRFLPASVVGPKLGYRKGLCMILKIVTNNQKYLCVLWQYEPNWNKRTWGVS